MVKILKEKDKEVQKQTQCNKIRKGQYNERYKHKQTEIPTEYLEKETREGSKRLIAKARCGNLEEGNRYWLVKEKRRCVLCQAEVGTLHHLLQECVATPREPIRIEEVVSGKINLKVEEWLRDVEKRKKRKTKGV